MNHACPWLLIVGTVECLYVEGFGSWARWEAKRLREQGVDARLFYEGEQVFPVKEVIYVQVGELWFCEQHNPNKSDEE